MIWATFLSQNVYVYLHSSTTLSFMQCAPEVAEFGEIMQNMGCIAVQCHSRPPILVPIESSYMTSTSY